MEVLNPNPKPQPYTFNPARLQRAAKVMLSANPHFRHFEGSDHGYGLLRRTSQPNYFGVSGLGVSALGFRI